jgi:hypothetical protein
MTAAISNPTASKKVSFGRALMAGLITIVASNIANLVVRWLGMLVLPVDPSFNPLATWQPTVLFTTGFLVLATIVFLVINAFTSNPPRVFNIVALIALILSLIPDFMMLINPNANPAVGTPTLGAVMILMIQHIVAYVITVWAFTRWAPQG